MIVIDLLVIGRSGQLAQRLAAIGRHEPHKITCVGRPELDVGDAKAVRALLERHPNTLVVNCAAYTAVDRAEAEPEEAERINRLGAANVAEAAAATGSPLIHISTDYVFDGRKAEPYREADPVGPLSVYARTKEAGEREVRARHRRAIILRTSWLYGPSGENFVCTMLRLGRERASLGIVADQTGSPTYVGDLADAILEIGRQVYRNAPPPTGTYHYGGVGTVSRYEFARAIFEEAATRGFRVPEIRPITTADYPTPATRPVNSALDCSRLAADYGIVPRPWRESLADCIAEIAARNPGSSSR